MISNVMYDSLSVCENTMTNVFSVIHFLLLLTGLFFEFLLQLKLIYIFQLLLKL